MEADPDRYARDVRDSVAGGHGAADRGVAVFGRRAAAAGAAVVPGLAVVAAATGVAMLIGRFIPTVSPLLIAIVLGAIGANVVSLPRRIEPGLTFSAKRLLRVGVALLGLQLVVGDVLALGWGVIAVIVAVVALGIVATMWVGALLGLTWTQRLLIACGFSICGAAAVAAVDGVVDSSEEETITAIALVVIFGTVMILAIPLLTDLFGLSDEQGGLWAGASIHEVAQVVAAGGAVGGGALVIATVVKLGRVLMLAPVLTVLGLVQRRRMAAGRAAGAAGAKRPALVPLFVAVFIAFVALRSTGIVPESALAVAEVCETVLLTAAMFALGTGVRIATMKKVGPKPFVLALASTVWVAAIGYVGVLLVN